MSCIYLCHTMTCLSCNTCFRSRWILRLDLDYIRIRKLLIDCSKKGILLFTVMSCLMYVMSHAHVMLHVTSHIMYEHDTSLWKKMVEKFFLYLLIEPEFKMTDETCHMTDVTFHMTLLFTWHLMTWHNSHNMWNEMQQIRRKNVIVILYCTINN